MALIGSSSTNTQTSSLSTTFLNSIINSTLSAQRQPINRLNSQKDQLSITKAVYSDLKSKLRTLNAVVEGLQSSDTNLVFNRKSASSSDLSNLTATATSSALNGVYSIKISDLAKTHRIRSDQQTSSSEELNLNGTFMINGKSIVVESTDTLQDIANSINNAEYDEGKGLIATIVDSHLIIEAKSTGASNQITASDTDGTVLANLGILDGESFKNVQQPAQNSSFTVNGIAVSKASNSGINDVINGVTINLLAKTEESKTITLTVQPDYSSIRAKVGAFVSNLNSTISYLEAKTQTVANQENKTYNRGALSGDSIFASLRVNLINALRTKINTESEGDPASLSDIGITIGSGLTISLNTNKLDSAIQSNMNGVIRLFDNVMGKFESMLEPFTTSSSSNTLDLYAKSVNTKIQNIKQRVSTLESVLKKKEEALIKQYSAIYIQNIEFTSKQYSILRGLYSTNV